MKEINPLMLITILCVSSMMAFLAVVGPIIRKLGLQEWHAGIMVALAGVAWIFLSRFWGKKSDIFGRRKILIFAIFGFFISYLLLAIFVNYALINTPLVIVSLSILILSRLFIGAFYSAVPPVSSALIADKVEINKRTSYMAKLGASNGIGMILGPIIGGVLVVYGLATPLYAAAFLPLIALFVVIFFLKDDKKIEKTKDTPLNYFDKRIRLPMIASFITMFSIVTSQVCLGFFILDKFHLEEIEASKITAYILAIIGLVFISTQIMVSKLRNIKSITWLILGSILASLGNILVIIISTKIELTIAFSIATIGLGMIMPAFMSITSTSVKANEQGVASGTVSSAQGFGIIIGPIFSTFLYKFSPEFPFLFSSLIFAILVIISLLYKKRGLVC